MKQALGWASRIAVAIAVFSGVLLGTAVSASAAPIDAVAPASIAKMDSGDDEPRRVGVDKSILMFRWVNGTQNFNYITDGSPLSSMERGTQRTVFYALPMAIGNGAWSGTSALLDGAVQFKPMQLVGDEIDQAAAGIGDSIIKSPLIAAAIVMASFSAIFSLKRGESPWKRLLTTVGIAAMFAVMVAGSGASTTVDGKYAPGTGSPGWFLTLVSNATTQITTSVAGSLATPQFEQGSGAASNCTAYTSAILAKGNEDRAKRNQTLPDTAPMSSYLWMQTGMKAWKLAQFGSNFYADRAYCHVLDWAYPKDAAAIYSKSPMYSGFPKPDENSAAFSPVSREQFDRSGIAWAVCQPNSSGGFNVNKAWFTDDGGTWKWGKGDTAQIAYQDTARYGPSIDKYTEENGICHKWWAEPAGSWDSEPFYIGPNEQDIRKFLGNELTGANAAVYDFLLNWRGADNTGIIVTSTYVFSSFIISGAFMVVTAAVFFVNIAVVVAMLSIFVVLLVVLFTKNEVGTRLGGFVKNLIGLIVFSAVAALLIAMLAKIVEVLGGLGESLFRNSPIAIMIWVGLSPLFALVMMHFVFTKLLKVPSPFKLSSALAWGAAAGAVGGAAGAGLAARGENAAERAAGRGIKKAGGAIANKAKGIVTGNKNEGRAGAATATDTKSASRKAAGAGSDSGDGKELSLKEQRAERKQALAEAKAARKEGNKEAKNDKFLSAADSLFGGSGMEPSRGFNPKGIVNKISRVTGGTDVFSKRNALEGKDRRSLEQRLSEGGMARSAVALSAAKKSISSGFSEYGEKWRSDPRSAIAQTVKKTAKYGALAVGTAATGGALGAVYAGVKANQAIRDAGYMGVGVPGGSRKYKDQQVEMFRESRRRAEETRVRAEAGREQSQQRQQQQQGREHGQQQQGRRRQQQQEERKQMPPPPPGRGSKA